MQNYKKEIIDSLGRKHDYLRISLTERCNLRCFYCMPENGVELRKKSCFMTSEEVIEIAKEFVKLGIKKIRLTGGEPLIKKDIKNILLELGKLPVELAITTNAVLVDKYIDVLKKAGVNSVNVSLDSLKESKFNQISRRNFFQRIKSNIDLLIEHGFNVKINVVIIRDLNDSEIPDFICWTKNKAIDVRFIEFMPFDGNKWKNNKIVASAEIINLAKEVFGEKNVHKLKGELNDTAVNYKLKNAKGSFGVISSITNPFCDNCNRIRLLADGKIKNCLFSQTETDILSAYRENQDIQILIKDSIFNKRKQRGGVFEFNDDQVKFLKNRTMIAIGG